MTENRCAVSTARTRIDQLKQLGIVTNVVGEVRDEDKYSLLVWAHKSPGLGFNITLGLCEYVSGKKPVVVIDNLLPAALFQQTSGQKQEIKTIYQNFFQERGCETLVLSELYQQVFGAALLSEFYKFSDRISVRDFLALLPERKKSELENLTYIESMHAINQLFTLEMVSQNLNRDVVVSPKFSQAMYLLHRDISQKPMSVIVTDVFGDNAQIAQRTAQIQSLHNLSQAV